MKYDPEMISLFSLIDDSDSFVRSAVRERIIEKGVDAVEQMEGWVREALTKGNLEEKLLFLDDVKAEIYLSRFVQLLQSPQPPLAKGFFMISKIAETYAEESIFNAALESLSNEFCVEISGEKTPFENIEIFNFLFFKKFGFSHTDTQMQRRDNARIDTVILSRAGNPVAISLTYFLLARAAGLPVYPLCFTGGFVPVYLSTEGNIEFYLNIFKQGAIFLEDTLVQFFEDIGMSYNPESLKIEEERALLTIYAELLNFVYKNNGNQLVCERMEKVVKALGGSRFL